MIERSKRIELRVTSEELKQIRERMQETGISSLTAYMIRMAIHGYVLKMDLTDLKELLRLMRRKPMRQAVFIGKILKN